jgi:hypothetical protein
MKAQKYISSKIKKIKTEGIRGRKVSTKQAIAVAISMARSKGYRIKKK